MFRKDAIFFRNLTVEHNLEFGGVSLRNLAETRRRMDKVYDTVPHS